jgi:hypothetical protein
LSKPIVVVHFDLNTALPKPGREAEVDYGILHDLAKRYKNHQIFQKSDLARNN